uniref:Integrin beta n=1 Tax=Magallana gigas TaxID=29159 RepID=K1QUZ5_MAGGI
MLLLLAAEDMSTITKNFKLGFGSFVDKVVMPYVSTAPNKINSPCPGCEKAYGFRNVHPLDPNATLFRDKVNAAKVSGNLDAPEGGFDAIMQAIACETEIGWRNRSRRMLLFSTDAGFHYAGDGKLGGIIQPNDGNCHLSPDGMYTESSNQDYPSISQVAVKAKEKNVNIIFAVTNDQKNIYDQLKPIIAGSETGVLASDSQNVVKLVRDNYLAITSKVEMIVENSDNLEVKFRTKCKGTEEKETNKCENLAIGESVDFSVTVEVKSCPPKGEEERTLRIKPVGLYDDLTVKLKLMCQCDCESPKQMINQTQSERYLATLSPEEIQRVTEARKTLDKQKKDFETVLSKGAQTIISARVEIADTLSKNFEELEEVRHLVVDQELIDWKRKQQLAGNGAPFDPNLLENLQKW